MRAYEVPSAPRRPRGACPVAGRGPRELDAATLDLLVAIGHQVGAAVERARLYEAAQTRSEDLAVLNDISRAIASTLDLETVLTVSMRGIREFLHVEVGSLALVDDISGQLVFRKGVREPDRFRIPVIVNSSAGVRQ